MRTVREIIEQFDVVYPNTITFPDKLSFLYGFEKQVFLTTYLIEKSDITIENFADSKPVVGFPFDDIYIKALTVFYYVKKGSFDAAGRAVALLSESLESIKDHIEHQLFEPLSEGG